jgi:hypothetical protein
LLLKIITLKEELEVFYHDEILIYFFNLCFLEAVIHALKSARNTKVHHRAVRDIPRSGTPEELYDLFGLSASKLLVEVKSILAENSA